MEINNSVFSKKTTQVQHKIKNNKSNNYLLDKTDIKKQNKNDNELSTEETAKIIGFFTKSLRNMGIGFILYKKENNGKLIEINEIEALEKLQKQEEVYFQMTKFSNFNLSVSNLFAYGALVSPIDTAIVKNVRDIMDKSSISNSIAIKNPGKEIKVGSPFAIKNFQELKIMYQVFNLNSKINPENQIEKVAQLLSNFIPKTFGTPYNWKFYDSENKTTLKEKLLKSLSKGIKFGSIIGITSSFIVAPIGAVLGLKILQIIGLIMGISTLVTASNATKELWKSIKDPKGKEIDPLTVIKNIINNKPIYFQEQKSTTITIPLIGEYTYYNDNRKEVKIKNIQDLELYSKIQG